MWVVLRYFPVMIYTLYLSELTVVLGPILVGYFTEREHSRITLPKQRNFRDCDGIIVQYAKEIDCQHKLQMLTSYNDFRNGMVSSNDKGRFPVMMWSTEVEKYTLQRTNQCDMLAPSGFEYVNITTTSFGECGCEFVYKKLAFSVKNIQMKDVIQFVTMGSFRENWYLDVTENMKEYLRWNFTLMGCSLTAKFHAGDIYFVTCACTFCQPRIPTKESCLDCEGGYSFCDFSRLCYQRDSDLEKETGCLEAKFDRIDIAQIPPKVNRRSGAFVGLSSLSTIMTISLLMYYIMRIKRSENITFDLPKIMVKIDGNNGVFEKLAYYVRNFFSIMHAMNDFLDWLLFG